MQLVCPAGNLPALQAAIDAGADAVYAGFRDQTNARAFPGLNFSDDELRDEGLVSTRREAQTVWYTLPAGPAHAIIATLYDIYCANDTAPRGAKNRRARSAPGRTRRTG